MLSMAHHKKLVKARSSAATLTALLLLTGCTDGATFLQESEQGGVVMYPFKGEQGTMLSSFRKDALALIKDKCPAGYTIVREGETKGRTRVAGAIEGGQDMVRERRWGIQFQCK